MTVVRRARESPRQDARRGEDVGIAGAAACEGEMRAGRGALRAGKPCAGERFVESRGKRGETIVGVDAGPEDARRAALGKKPMSRKATSKRSGIEWLRRRLLHAVEVSGLRRGTSG